MLRVLLLGERRLLVDGNDVGSELQYRKAWALLGYLVVECRRRHSREHLAALLWPSLPPVAARTNLRQVVSNLNRVFEACGVPSLLQASRDDVGLVPQPDVSIDVHEVERCVEASSTELLGLDESAIGAGGEFLAGLHLEDCPDFEEWLPPVRAQLAASSVRALRRLLDAQQAAGLGRRALATVRRLAILEPWDEAVVRQYMTLLAAEGAHAEALQVHARLVKALRDDLGAVPSAATGALCEAIRVAMEAGVPFVPSPVAGVPVASRHWACGLVCRVDAGEAGAAAALLGEVAAWFQEAGAKLLFANDETVHAAVVAEADPGDPTEVAVRAARLAAVAVSAFPARLAVALCPALVQSHPQTGLALLGNAGEWAMHLLPHARTDAVILCDALFENLFECFALHPQVEVAVPDLARPLRLWRLGADGIATSGELAESALAESARPAQARTDDDGAFEPSLLTLRLGDVPPDDGLAASAWLTVVAGADRGKRVGIADRPVVVGRASDCDLHLPRRTVSRHHCVIWRHGEHYRLRDLGATNRTRLNGIVVRDARLAEGDRLAVGECTLVFGREI